MSRFRFLHAADLHLDTPFDGLGAVRPELARALRDASLDAFDRLVAEAIRRRVEFVLLAGDLYDGPERGLRAQFRLLRGLERLSAAGIETFVVHGNHDPLEEGWSALRTLPAGVHVFAAGAPASVPVVRDGRRIALVHGVSYGQRAERENLALRFRRAPGEGLQVGLLHANVEGQRGHDPYAPCTLADLHRIGLDYWALGHVHRRQILSEGPSWVVYAGNLQGRSFKPTECGPRGAVLVEVEAGAVSRVEPVDLAPVRFESLEVDIAGMGELAEVQGALLRRLPTDAGVDGVMVRVRLVGRGPLHGELQRAGEGLREALEDATAGWAPWIGWERFEVETAPPVDREALLSRDDFAGSLLRRISSLGDDELRALVERIDGELARGAVARVLEPAGEEELHRLRRQVEAIAVDWMGGLP